MRFLLLTSTFVYCSLTLCYLVFETLKNEQSESPNGRTYSLIEDSLKTLIHSTTPTPDQVIDVKSPKIHIGFLKVHKAASSTVQAILLRFGWKRNLTFALPPEYNKFGFPNIISTHDPPNENNTLPPPDNKPYDVLCHHVIYGKKEWDRILQPGYALIGVVREPWGLFMATLNYMKPWYLDSIKDANFIHVFLADPMKYEPDKYSHTVTNNRMSFEFGLSPDIILNRDIPAFEEYLKRLDQEFGVVIVADHFDESLVLMKRILHWSLGDILYIAKNVKTSEYDITFEPTLEDKMRFENLSIFDRRLYDFFKKRFYNQVAAEGSRFSHEVRYFRTIRQYVEDFCKLAPKSIKAVQIDESEWNSLFEVDQDDCRLLRKQELNFTQNIRIRQFGYATWTMPVKTNTTDTT